MTLNFIRLLIISCLFFSACKVKKAKKIGEQHMESTEQIKENTPTEILQYGMYVASKRVSCEGIVPQKCMLVRSRGKSEWTNFYDTIEGFNYVPGYEYHLEVKRTTLKNPPADGSAYRYQLVNLLKKERKESDIRKEYEKATFDGNWDLTDLKGKLVSEYKAKIFFDLGAKLRASSGCNTTTNVSFYTDNSNKFRLKKNSPMGATRMACPNGHIEKEYFKTLFDIEKYEATTHILRFFDKKDNLILVFKR